MNNGSYGVDNSYGSPYTVGISIWNTYPDGTIVGYHDAYFNSYGSYSPDTSDIQFVWMAFPSGFINHNFDYTITYSYGALRTHLIPTTLGKSTRPVTSTATTVSTALPTVYSLSAHE